MMSTASAPQEKAQRLVVVEPDTMSTRRAVMLSSNLAQRLDHPGPRGETLATRLHERDQRTELLLQTLNENTLASRERAHERAADVNARRLRMQASLKRNALERVIVVSERVLAHTAEQENVRHQTREARARLADAVRNRRLDLENMREVVNRHEADADFLAGGSAVLEPFRPPPVFVPADSSATRAPSPYIAYDERHGDDDDDDDDDDEEDDEEGDAERAARVARLEAQVAALRKQLGGAEAQDPGFPVYCDTPLLYMRSPFAPGSSHSPSEMQGMVQVPGARGLQPLDNLEC